MKKTLLIFFLTTSTVITFAQTVNFGIKAGLNLSEIYRSNSFGIVSNFLPGFSIGGIADIGFQKFSIQPGIFYSTKGEKTSGQFIFPNEPGTQLVSSKTTWNYIEVPVNFLYKNQITPVVTLHAGGGPYIGYGVSEVITSVNNGLPNFDSSHKYLGKNPDYGINFIAGIVIKNKFIIDGGYGLGLANLSYNGFNSENRVISFSAGYLFR